MSLDGVFLAVTLLTGAVKLIKMPPVLNPLDADKTPAQGADIPGSRDSVTKPPTVGGKTSVERTSAELGSIGSIGVTSDENPTIILKNDLEKFAFEELQLEKQLITTIAAKKKNEFVDPFALDEEKKEQSQQDETLAEISKQSLSKKQPSVINPADIPPVEEDDGSFKHRLGKKHYKDGEEGDLGCLYKEPDVMPNLFFIRASFCNKLNAQMPHAEL